MTSNVDCGFCGRNVEWCKCDMRAIADRSNRQLAENNATIQGLERENEIKLNLLKLHSDRVAELEARMVDLRRPTHGPCCTCQRCGKHYDDCRCSIDALADDLEIANKKIAELECELALTQSKLDFERSDHLKQCEYSGRLEADRDALAAALSATPMPSMIDNDAPGQEQANLTLTWPKQRVFDWWATREPDFITARKILSARLAAERKAGAVEALRKRRVRQTRIGRVRTQSPTG